MAARMVFLLAAAILSLCGGPAAAETPDPKVPAGRDPGGVAVAIVGPGLDYRRPEFHRRLARDGEGELVAWDFADDDPRPFSGVEVDAALASIVLAESPATRLVLARVPAGRHDLIAAAFRFAAQSPARVLLLGADPGRPLQRADLIVATRHLPGLLVVVPARHVAEENRDGALEQGERAGLLLVAAEGGSVTADVAVAVTGSDAGPAVRGAADVRPDDIAAARVAALAARSIAIEPTLSGAGLRAHILSFAEPVALGPPLISGIRRIDWRE